MEKKEEKIKIENEKREITTPTRDLTRITCNFKIKFAERLYIYIIDTSSSS